MNRIEVKEGNLAISRIEEKCIQCGMCLKTCSENNGLEKDCINCGQCILTCPTGALVPKYDYRTVMNYIKDTDYEVVVMTAPAVRVAIGDEFGFEPGSFLEGKLVSALKKIGFSKVFDITFGADLTVMEEAKELVEKIKNSGKFPMFTSCCPSWVLYMEKYFPNDVNKLSSCKSPIAMLGTMIKTYYADFNEKDPDKIITVALTPCVSKKAEMAMYKDVDFVITTRELAMMIRELEIPFKSLEDSKYDELLGKGSTAGVIFGASGGVMEAALRTAYYMLNHEKAPQEFFSLESLRGEKDVKTAVVDMKVCQIKVAVINRISTVKKVYDSLKDYHFVEVMTCPGGCVGGAGQPLVMANKMAEYRQKRINSLYENDRSEQIKESHENPEIKEAYETYINRKQVSLHTKHKTYTNV